MGCGHIATGNFVTGHIVKDKMPHGQNVTVHIVTGQNATQTKVHRSVTQTKCHINKMSQDNMSQEKM